jgi:hypothetical protein
MKPRTTLDTASPSGSHPKVKIIVQPDNVALIFGPAGHLRALRGYEAYLLDAGALTADGQGYEVRPDCAVPAGLLPRIEAALAADGWSVATEDRRRPGAELPSLQRRLRHSYGSGQALLRAVAAAPLGQVLFVRWPDLLWKTAHLARAYGAAPTVVVVDGVSPAGRLRCELAPAMSESVGLLRRRGDGTTKRCAVATLPAVRGLQPGAWPVVILVVFHSRTLSPATYQALVGLGARRRYAVVGSGLRLGRPTRLRLEALAGRPIYPPPAA